MKTVLCITLISYLIAFPQGQQHQFALPYNSEEMREWCYHKPSCGESTWRGNCASGQLQSPIDLPQIPEENVTCHIDNFPWTTYESNLFLMESNGRTVAIKLLDYRPNFYWAEQRASYTLHSIHFHWGPNDTLGSEHGIDSHQFAMEMQMVHYKDSYRSIRDALDSEKKNALAIISVLFEVQPKLRTNLVFETILKYLPGVHYSNAVITVKEHLDLKQFLRGNQVLSYMGSLTSPGCNEQVAWMVWRRTLYISKEDIDNFRKVRDPTGKPLKMNSRSIQPRNNRSVQLCEVTMAKRKKTN